MAAIDPLDRLKQGPEAWNDWRQKNPGEHPSFSGRDLRGINLSGGFDLRDVSLIEANLKRVNLAGADLRGADLSFAKCRNAWFTGCDVTGAKLNWAKMQDTWLVGATFRRANLRHADLTGANLRDTDLSEADVRFVQGLQLDSTIIRHTRFGPRPTDLWSTLRRKYTGVNLLLNLLLLLLFVLPYAAQTLVFVGINRAQVAGADLLQRLGPVTRALAEAERRLGALSISANEAPAPELADALKARIVSQVDAARAAITRVSSALSTVGPCLREHCRESSVWRQLIGVDRGVGVWLTAVLLIGYNLCRLLLTVRVGMLRDDEERSGWSPPFQYGESERPHSPRKRSQWRVAMDWWQLYAFGYGWLKWPHRVISVLVWVAITSFVLHMWSVLATPVWIGPGPTP